MESLRDIFQEPFPIFCGVILLILFVTALIPTPEPCASCEGEKGLRVEKLKLEVEKLKLKLTLKSEKGEHQ